MLRTEVALRRTRVGVGDATTSPRCARTSELACLHCSTPKAFGSGEPFTSPCDVLPARSQGHSALLPMQSVRQTVLRCSHTNHSAITAIFYHPRAIISANTQIYRKLGTSSHLQKKQELYASHPLSDVKAPEPGLKKKPTRPSAVKTSLRRVAVEAATLIRTRGKTRFVDPNAERKVELSVEASTSGIWSLTFIRVLRHIVQLKPTTSPVWRSS
jgi:hypothetical protein